MWAEWSVELGANSPRLGIPWSSPDGVLRYFDLKRHPELMGSLPEASKFPALREFLSEINSAASPWETAKCDLWGSDEITVEEEVFGMPRKFGSYIDILFSASHLWRSFAHHEKLARRITSKLRAVTVEFTTAEFIIRAGVRPIQASSSPEDCRSGSSVEEGFYFTFYLYGYGEEEAEACERWSIALNRVQSKLVQLSRNI